jgi:hypothetical protein
VDFGAKDDSICSIAVSSVSDSTGDLAGRRASAAWAASYILRRCSGDCALRSAMALRIACSNRSLSITARKSRTPGGQAFPRHVIDDVQHPEAPSAGELVMHEVE